MKGHLFVAQGDITRLAADAIAFSASTGLARDGNLCSSFEANVPGFAEWYRGLGRREGAPVAVGSTFWLPLPEGRGPNGVVVVVSTGRDAHPDKPGLAVRSAIDAAVGKLRESGQKGRLLVALPAFRVGKGGDHRQRLQSARSQVQAAREAMGGHDGVDVAFITYTPALYRIFVEARREVAGPPSDRLAYPELERALSDGNCVFFVGAGLSAGSGLPGWNELMERLARDLQVEPSGKIDHLDLAQWYREQFGNDRLADVLRSTFGGDGLPTLAHYLFLGLPVRRVITTNYDHLIEQALTALNRHPLPVVRQQDVPHTGGAGVYVVKLHGDADFPADIVLSRDDYNAFFEQRPAMALLLEGMLLNQTFFFVGYSLRDPNFRQVFSRIARMLQEARRPAFATSFEADGDAAGYLRRQWRRQRLELIPVPGGSIAEQERQFLSFLDALAENVAVREPPLALAGDVPAPPGCERLRELLTAAGGEVERLCREGAGEATNQFLAQVLDFLTTHGWRPGGDRGRQLCRLYEELANRTDDLDRRRRLLVAALGCAEAFTDARRLREQLGADEPRTQ